jgi:subtilisin
MSTSRLAFAFLVTSACLAVCAPLGLAAEEKVRYIVLLKESVKHPGDVAYRHASNRGAQISHVYGTALKGYAAKLEPAQAEAVARDPLVVSVERDVKGSGEVQSTPTAVKRVFASSNTALKIDEKDTRVEADVAVLDTGLDITHKDLYITSLVDCTGTKCEEGKGEDKNGHGTGVAGLIGAIDNSSGIVGIAPGVRLWSVKVLDDNNEGFLSEYIAGVNWVTKWAEKIEVANASLSYPAEESKALVTALDNSTKAGVVHVVAAGNQKKDASTRVPANQNDVITVSAIADYDGKPGNEAAALWEPGCTVNKVAKTDELVGADDTSYTYSNNGTLIEVTAPGVCILTTALGDKYKLESGTSMAAPQVSGAAAILASLSNPNSREAVESIRFTIIKSGNVVDWTDTSEDVVTEPLLEMSDEEIFKLE